MGFNQFQLLTPNGPLLVLSSHASSDAFLEEIDSSDRVRVTPYNDPMSEIILHTGSIYGIKKIELAVRTGEGLYTPLSYLRGAWSTNK